MAAIPLSIPLIATSYRVLLFVRGVRLAFAERFKRFERKGCKQCGDIRFETYTGALLSFLFVCELLASWVCLLLVATCGIEVLCVVVAIL